MACKKYESCIDNKDFESLEKLLLEDGEQLIVQVSIKWKMLDKIITLTCITLLIVW